MGAGELKESDFRKIAKLMSEDFKEEVNSHMTEAFEIHRVKLKEEFKIIHDSHASEVIAAIEQQNKYISLKSEEIDQRLKRVDVFLDNYPEFDLYIKISQKIKINIRKAIIFVTVTTIIVLGAFKLIKFID